jgi:hypothetical protein
MIQIKPDMRLAQEYLNRLEKRDLPRVVGRSLDRTGKSVQSLFSRRLRERIALKKAVVDASLKTRRSGEIQNLTALSLGRAWVELRVNGKPIPLREFTARQTSKGVTFKVAKKGGRKRYLALGQPAFIVASMGGNVFVRKGPEPPGPQTIGIRKVYGPSLPQFLLSKKEQRELIAHAAKVWPQEIERNARFALRRRGAL